MNRALRATFVMLATALAFATATAADAAVPPEARKILDRYIEVTGGRAALLAERSQHVWAGVSALGFSGRIESWNQRPDRRASVTVLGPFTLRDGHDGATAWRVDQNGKLAMRDGRDLEEARASTWFDNDLWLLEDGGTITVVGSEKDSAGTCDVLEIAPPHGRSRRLWFDRATGLHARTIIKDDQRTVVTSYSDWQTMAGRRRARSSLIRVEGMALNDARLTVDSMRVNDAIDPAIFAPPVIATHDVRFLGGGALARLPFDYRTRHLWVRASVNGGPPEDFLLDTGASTTVLDSAWAAGKGIRVEGRVQAAGAGATGTASFATLDSIRVDGVEGGGVVLTGQKIAVLSLNPFLEPFFWTPVAGVLGYDFISRFVMVVDYDAERLTIHDPKTFRYEGKGAAIPLTLAGNIPVVEAKLDDRFDGKFRLDIGSGSTVDVHGPFARLNDLASLMKGNVEILGGGFGGTFTSRIGRMKRMAIGPFAWDDPIVSLSGATSGGFASEDYAGNIGNQLLERFRATFDYERRTVHLEPGARYGERDRFSKAGLLIAKMPDGYRAMQVLEGSAAAKAGVREGDRVTAVDGRPIERWTQDELARRFEDGAVGEKHTVEVERNGKRSKLTMKLAEIL